MRYFLGFINMLQMLNKVVIWDGLNTAIIGIFVLIVFWNRLLNMEDSRLIKHIFHWDYVNQRCWCQCIKHWLIQPDLECVFSEKLSIDIDRIKIQLNDLMQEQWSNEMHNKPKLRTFAQIKGIFEPEPYVLSNISLQRRSLLARIRLGILPIKIETGRFRSLPVEQRLCELCEMHKVENEIHVLREYPLCHDFSETLYDHTKRMTNDFVTMGMQEKIVYLVKHMRREVSCYLVQSWSIRKDNLYNT